MEKDGRDGLAVAISVLADKVARARADLREAADDGDWALVEYAVLDLLDIQVQLRRQAGARGREARRLRIV